MYWSGSGICNIFDVILGIERVKAAVTVVFYLLNSAAQEPGVVKVQVYSDAGEFLGETNFEYEDILDTVAFQAVQLGPDGWSKLVARMEKHIRNQRSSATQSSSAKQNSGESD